MTNIETLLKQISEIVVKERIQQEEKRKRGENFNIFSVLGLSTSEVRLHSAFLGELLNPEGDHGLGNKFLEAFLKMIINRVKPGFEIDTKSCKVDVELPIGEIPEDYSEGGRIDLLIQDSQKNAIIIEKKIYADDQYKQLLRYHNWATKNSQKYILLYLTLYEKEPTEYSTDNQVDYKCISYKNNIIPWLQNCIGIAALHPNIREIIAQYKLNLDNILDIMSESTTKEILNVLLDESNIESTLNVMDYYYDVRYTIRNNFVQRIKEELTPLMDKYNMVFDSSEIDDFVNLRSGYPGLYFRMTAHPLVSFKIEIYRKEACYGLVIDEQTYNPKALIIDNHLWDDPNGAWPHGWAYFEDGIRYWDGSEALLDMVKGDRIISTIKEELEKAINNNCFEEIEQLVRGRK